MTGPQRIRDSQGVPPMAKGARFSDRPFCFPSIFVKQGT